MQAKIFQVFSILNMTALETHLGENEYKIREVLDCTL